MVNLATTKQLTTLDNSYSAAPYCRQLDAPSLYVLLIEPIHQPL